MPVNGHKLINFCMWSRKSISVCHLDFRSELINFPYCNSVHPVGKVKRFVVLLAMLVRKKLY